MRIGIVSDIHGNLLALEALLAELERASLDRVLCLGDVAAVGPWPHESIDRLRQLDWHFVMGNTDAWLLEPKLESPHHPDARRMEEIELWGSRQLTPEDRAFVAGFAPMVEVDLEGEQRLVAYHGAPASFSIEILPSTPTEDLDTHLGQHTASVYAGGHTHEAMIRRHRSALVVNPGSVGLPFEQLDSGEAWSPPYAEYAVLESDETRLSVTLCRLPIDVQRLAAAARETEQPHNEWWISHWLR
jgi:predicted phosphodiesterase